MKIIPKGKGWFIWQIKRVYGGDPTQIAAAAVAQGVLWVSIKINDGTADYNLRPQGSGYADDLIQPLVDALHAQGIMVFGWGYIYLNSAKKEADKSIERTKIFGLDGFMVDAESEWKGKLGAAQIYMDTLRAGLPDTSIGMCSYRFPSQHTDFPWYTALEKCDYHAPQVYWVEAHNPTAQLNQSVAELTAKKTMPIVPIGYAYQNETDGTKPTQAEIIAFHDRAIALGLPGVGWYEWGDAIVNADVEKFIAPLVWDPNNPPPPAPEGDIMYKGIVLLAKLNVRVSPRASSQDVGDLFKDNAVEGSEIVTAAGYDWLFLTKPTGFSGRYVALGPTTAPRSYVQITEFQPSPPIPQTVEERLVALERDVASIKKKLLMI